MDDNQPDNGDEDIQEMLEELDGISNELQNVHIFNFTFGCFLDIYIAN